MSSRTPNLLDICRAFLSSPRPYLNARTNTHNNCHTTDVWQARKTRTKVIAGPSNHEILVTVTPSYPPVTTNGRTEQRAKRRGKRICRPKRMTRTNVSRARRFFCTSFFVFLLRLPLVVARRTDCRRAFGNTHIAGLAREASWSAKRRFIYILADGAAQCAAERYVARHHVFRSDPLSREASLRDVLRS